MVCRRIGALFIVAVLGLQVLAATPEASLATGVNAFRGGDWATAVSELTVAADPGAPPEIQQLALVYLSLAQFRLGLENESRATIERLLEVERTSPAYASLPLENDAAEFETLATALVPGAALPHNEPIVDPEAATPLPAVVRRAEPLAEPVIAPVPAPVAPPVVSNVDADDAVRNALSDLRQADALANNGDVEDARRMYARLATSPAREVITAAAVGLYRVGSYRDAIAAFQRLGTFARGEEDLHFYYAVSLYEIGDARAARKELSCALPFIEVTDEVTRARIKIERSQS